MDDLIAFNQALAANTQQYEEDVSAISQKNALEEAKGKVSKEIVEPLSTEFLREGFSPIGKYVSSKVVEKLGDSFKGIKNVVEDFQEGGLQNVVRGGVRRAVQPIQEQVAQQVAGLPDRLPAVPKVPTQDDFLEEAFKRANPNRSEEEVKSAISSLKDKDEFLRQYRNQGEGLDQTLSDADVEALRMRRINKLVGKGKQMLEEKAQQLRGDLEEGAEDVGGRLQDALSPGYRVLADIQGRATSVEPTNLLEQASQRAREAVQLPAGAEIEELGEEGRAMAQENLAIEGPSMMDRLSGIKDSIQQGKNTLTSQVEDVAGQAKSQLKDATSSVEDVATDAMKGATGEAENIGESVAKSVGKNVAKDVAEDAVEGASEALDFDPITAPLGVLLGLGGVLFGAGLFDHHKHHNVPTIVNTSSQFGTA